MAKLVLIRGPPGAGKSTLSVKVANKLRGATIVIPKDPINSRFHFANIKKARFYSEGVINSIAKYYLKNKINVVVEGVFGGKNSLNKINQLSRLTKLCDAKFFLINLDVDLEISLLRNLKRKKDLSKSEVTRWRKHFYLQPIQKGFLLDNNRISERKAVNEILKYVSH